MLSKKVRIVALVGTGIGSFFLLTNKKKSIAEHMKKLVAFSPKETKLSKAGNPDPNNIEDANMVNEGAMYAVTYYNKKRPEE